MEQIDALLDASPTPPQAPEIRLEAPRPGDAGWIIQRHGELYARDEGFDTDFEALVAEIVADFLRNLDSGRARCWIARGLDDRRLGCIFCFHLDDRTAQLRLFLVEPEARGTGLGRRLLAECLDHARACGYARMKLWTHESHRAACALYAATGFRLTDRRPVQHFGQSLVELSWEIDL
nr:GNAT family N-acetyltransferase [Tropicimonas sp. IMCC34043]